MIVEKLLVFGWWFANRQVMILPSGNTTYKVETASSKIIDESVGLHYSQLNKVDE